MKIMMIANDTNFVFNLRQEVLKTFIAAGHETVLVAMAHNHKEDIESFGVKFINVEYNRQGSNPFSDLVLMKRYYQILKLEKPDVVFTNNIKPNVYAGICCKTLGIKYVVNVCGLGTPVENPGLMQKLTVWMYKMGVSGAHTVFFQNSENQDFFHIHKMLNKKNSEVLLPGSGVALNRFPLLPYPQDDVVNFLFIARIQKEKGIDLYLNAAKFIRNKYPNTVFHICGGCDDETYLDILKDAESNGYVKYHGQQKNMKPFIEMASCIVHPSYYPEGMSNVLLEGAASGRPVIATDRSGCRETVDNGISGYVIPIKNQEALNNALEEFMFLSVSEREQMGLAGRSKMERQFDRNFVVKEYLKIIEG